MVQVLFLRALGESDGYEERTQELLNSTSSKLEFLSMISHELRTPMNSVLGFSSLLSDSALNSQQREYLSCIRSAGEALVSTINDVLDYFKIEEERFKLEQISFDLRELIDDCLEVVGASLRHIDVKLMTSISPRVATGLRGDPARLKKVLLNLLSNAVRYTEIGTISLFVECLDDQPHSQRLRFSVQDTRPGMAPNKRGDLFQSYIQADASTNCRFGGTGLGLAISKKLVSLMGGVIAADSLPGEGSNFWFQLSFPKSVREKTAVCVESLYGKKALLVECNPVCREEMRSCLRDLGLEVTEVLNPAKALSLCKPSGDGTIAFDYIFVSEQMPSIDGAGLIRSVRAYPGGAKTKVFLLSEWRTVVDNELRQGLRIAGQISKPYRTREIRMALEYADEVVAESVKHAPSSLIPLQASQSVLVVEDNRVNQLLAQAMLRKLGLRVTLASNGEEALTICRKNNFDLILMDCHMPVLDGFQATRKIRQMGEPGKHVPIIALTADVLDASREDCLSSGMNDYLSKPFHADLFREKVENWLQRSAK